ncbi:P-loop containing nucleoside triphosphate hydrolase protein [Mycena crocata]|nr:P-loop containing nucleoside triphosphate hydrolase protein [Mycena crocata]
MPDPFVWSSSRGHDLVRQIIRTTPVPYIPHDFQVEGLCKSLDGKNLFAITPTSSGKTSYYILYILVILAVLKDPSLCPSAKFPENPCLLVVCPTVPLQLEKEENMKNLGIKAVAINAETQCDARRRHNQDLWFLARTEPNVILTDPEQLKTAEYEAALRDDDFQKRICGTGFDEVHLLNTWGSSFCKDFLQMGFVKARMQDVHNPWILTSATVRDGASFENICRLFGLDHSDFHLIRRSSARPDVQLLFRDLISPVSGDSFPELDWVLEDDRPKIIFPKHISLACRIHAYLLRKSKSNNPNRIRLYNSLNFDSHNAETRELLKQLPGLENYCQIVIGTDSLSVGVGMPARLDAVILGDIEDADNLFQKLGRIGRLKDAAQRARCIVYISTATWKLAKKRLDDDEAGVQPKAGEPSPDLSMPKLILAQCKVKAIDQLYNNPTSEPVCTCPPCVESPRPGPRTPCDCSGCLPEIITPPSRPTCPSKVDTNIPPAQRLSKLQKAHGLERLLQLRLEIWKDADKTKCWMLPRLYFYPISSLLLFLTTSCFLIPSRK